MWIVVDGAYAARPHLDSVLAAGAVVVSRIRKDAVLFDLPPARIPVNAADRASTARSSVWSSVRNFPTAVSRSLTSVVVSQ